MRLARLLKVLGQFAGAQHGLTMAELASRLGVSKRTAERDRRALEDHLRVPFYNEGARYRVLPGYWLQPVSFSLREAVGLLLGTRLMMHHADKADPFTAAAYERLSQVLPDAVRQPIADAAHELSTKPTNQEYVAVLARLIDAWAGRRQVEITYHGTRRTVWPLVFEPSAVGHSTYLLAWDPSSAGPRQFKVERIEQATVLDVTFSSPPGFSQERYLAGAWGVWGSEEPVEVELVFSARAAARVRETRWHPSQKLEPLPGGRLRMILRVGAWLELRHWVLGWGENCEVLRPAELRASIIEAVTSLSHVYSVQGGAPIEELVSGVRSPVRLARRSARSREESSNRNSAADCDRGLTRSPCSIGT